MIFVHHSTPRPYWVLSPHRISNYSNHLEFVCSGLLPYSTLRHKNSAFSLRNFCRFWVPVSLGDRIILWIALRRTLFVYNSIGMVFEFHDVLFRFIFWWSETFFTCSLPYPNRAFSCTNTEFRTYLRKTFKSQSSELLFLHLCIHAYTPY